MCEGPPSPSPLPAKQLQCPVGITKPYDMHISLQSGVKLYELLDHDRSGGFSSLSYERGNPKSNSD